MTPLTGTGQPIREGMEAQSSSTPKMVTIASVCGELAAKITKIEDALQFRKTEKETAKDVPSQGKLDDLRIFLNNQVNRLDKIVIDLKTLG